MSPWYVMVEFYGVLTHRCARSPRAPSCAMERWLSEVVASSWRELGPDVSQFEGGDVQLPQIAIEYAGIRCVFTCWRGFEVLMMLGVRVWVVYVPTQSLQCSRMRGAAWWTSWTTANDRSTMRSLTHSLTIVRFTALNGLERKLLGRSFLTGNANRRVKNGTQRIPTRALNLFEFIGGRDLQWDCCYARCTPSQLASEFEVVRFSKALHNSCVNSRYWWHRESSVGVYVFRILASSIFPWIFL